MWCGPERNGWSAQRTLHLVLQHILCISVPSAVASARFLLAYSAACQVGVADQEARARPGKQAAGIVEMIDGNHGEIFDNLAIDAAVKVHVGPGEDLGQPPAGDRVWVGVVTAERCGCVLRVTGVAQAPERWADHALRSRQGDDLASMYHQPRCRDQAFDQLADPGRNAGAADSR